MKGNHKHGCTIVSERNINNPKWRAHVCWVAMKKRCTNPDKKDEKNYKGRGITFDPRWSIFNNFLEDMGLPPEGTSLDRGNNNEGYSKDNCRWATKQQQNRNKRSNRVLEFNGKKRLTCEWAEVLGVKKRLLYVRLNRGWSVERTLSTPQLTLGSNGSKQTIATHTFIL